MIRLLPPAILVCVSACLGFSQTSTERMTPLEQSERAGELARGGHTDEALRLYEAALAKERDNLEVRADYATVLGWAERYPESIAQFRLVVGQNPQQQPDWVLREFARSQLFGDLPADALATLDELIGRSDDSEATLCRRGLALRWLNRPKDAEKAYQDALQRHPRSTMAHIGVIYSVADRNQLARALSMVNQAIQRDPGQWEFVKVKGQVLNWMGRHRDALQVLHTIDAVNDRELLESRISAARWGGKPGEAKSTAKTLVKNYPGTPAAEKLRRDIGLEYGRKVGASVRVASDTDGMTDRLFEEVFAMHAGAANRFEFAVEQRQLSMEQSVGWRRAALNWSGELSSRLSAYGALNEVDYRGVPRPSQFFRDGALTYAVNDRVRISGGGGSAAVDAFRAVQNRVTSDFYYGEISLQPAPGVRFSAKYAHARFSDAVDRNRADVEGFWRLHTSRRVRFDVGGSGNWMNHSRETADFFSPPKFYSVLGKVQLSGRVSSRIEYTAQIGAGIQREAVYALQSPLVATGTVFARLNRHLMLQVDAGRSTSSLERINPGRESYARFVVAAGLAYRFE